MRTTDGSGGAITSLTDRGRLRRAASPFGDVSALSLSCPGVSASRSFLHRLDGLLWPADAAHLEIAEQRQHRGGEHHDAEHDQEGHPPPQPGVEQFGEEEEEKERGVEQHHQRQDEEDAAGEALLDVAGDLGVGQFDLGPHQRRHLRRRVFDEVTDRRVVPWGRAGRPAVSRSRSSARHPCDHSRNTSSRIRCQSRSCCHVASTETIPADDRLARLDGRAARRWGLDT